jgi:two-component system KDP operon response regulator KdpE
MSKNLETCSRDRGIMPQDNFRRILVVEEGYSVRHALHLTLHNQGVDVADTPPGTDVLAFVRGNGCDAVLLDIDTLEQHGIEVCRELRLLFPFLTILTLSVQGGLDAAVEALDAGADDYVVTPVRVRELTARIRAATRRNRVVEGEADHSIRIGEICLYPGRRITQKAGRDVHLTPKEFDLLHYLMSRSGVPVSHEKLLAAVWGPGYVGQVEYLRVFMWQLRKKLEDDPPKPRYLITDSSFGYRFVDSFSFGRSSAERHLVQHVEGC